MASTSRIAARGLLPSSNTALGNSWRPLTRRCFASAARTRPFLARARLFPTQSASPPLRHPAQDAYGRILAGAWRRHNSSVPSDPARPLPDPSSTEPVRRDVPSYDLTFTCQPCKTRSTHNVSKQGYHKGTVIVTCPNCKNRHLISDHLHIFMDEDMTIDKYLEGLGEVVKRGSLGPNGDIEIWDRKTDDPTKGRHVGAPWDEGKKP